MRQNVCMPVPAFNTGSDRYPPVFFYNDNQKDLLTDCYQICCAKGFKSYGEVRTWLRAICGREADYKTVDKTVRYRLKSKLKVPRRVSVKQPEGATEDFKKKLPRFLKSIVEKFKDISHLGRRLRYVDCHRSRTLLADIALDLLFWTNRLTHNQRPLT